MTSYALIFAVLCQFSFGDCRQTEQPIAHFRSLKQCERVADDLNQIYPWKSDIQQEHLVYRDYVLYCEGD